MKGDLLAIPNDPEDSPNFRNAFWGADHKGFEVLYASLKSAPAASKEIAEFIREVACQHDQLAKNLARLGKQEKTNAQHILLSPIWKILKTTMENSGAAHQDLAQRLFEISREIRKYSEEGCRERYKSHKKELLATGQACTKMQHATAHLLKSKESRTRIESSNSSGSKHEKQLRRSADDMKRHVDSYNQALEIFEPAMIASTEVLEDLEKDHVERLCDYMTKLHKGYDSCIAISQINNAAFQETLANNAKPEYILGQFAKRRGTGMERPKMENFDPGEAGAGNISISPEKQRTDDSNSFNRSVSSANSTSSEPVQRQESLNGKPKMSSFLRPSAANKSDTDSHIVKSNVHTNSDSENDLEKDKPKRMAKSPVKATRVESKSSAEVDEDGFTIRKPTVSDRSRKSSTSSDSSGWDFEEDGKLDTYKIKVQIKSLEEIEKEKAAKESMQSVIKLDAPLAAAPTRKAPRPGRSPRTVPPSVSPVTIPPPLLPILPEKPTGLPSSPSEDKTDELHENSASILLNESNPEKIRESPTKSPSLTQSSSALRTRPLTPIKTGGSLLSENITWTQPQGTPYDAPIASIESLSPVMTPTSPVNANGDIFIRTAITETVNAKFLAVGEKNTQVLNNADLYLDFPASALKSLNNTQNFELKIEGGVAQVKVNPAFGRGEDNIIRLDLECLMTFLQKMARDRPSQSHHMMKIASYRVKCTASNLPLLLASYWKKEKDDYKVKVVAKPTTKIAQLKLLLKSSTFHECESETPHHVENGFSTFQLENLESGVEQSMTAYLSKCPNPTAFAAQFSSNSLTLSSVSVPEKSSLKIKDSRRRMKIGFYISEPIL